MRGCVSGLVSGCINRATYPPNTSHVIVVVASTDLLRGWVERVG